MVRLSATIALLFMLVGCGAQDRAVDNGRDDLVKVKSTTIDEVDRETGQKVSKHLVELATGVPDVRDATAVVIGNYAIVGIDVDKDIDRSQVGSIKYSVAESMKNDPHGARAVVIADPDINARLKEIAADIRNGHPVSGIMNELSDITGRLMPEVPADLLNPKGRNATENPKKEMNKNDSKQLEKEQDDQSKHKKD